MTSSPTNSDHAHADRRRRWFALTTAFAAVAASVLVLVAGPAAAPVSAAGSPDIVLTKTADAKTLIGDPTNVTLRACNPLGQPNGYNLSFRDVVPAGLALLSADPAPSRQVVEPAGRRTRPR